MISSNNPMQQTTVSHMSYQIEVLCEQPSKLELTSIGLEHLRQQHTTDHVMYRAWFYCPDNKTYLSCNIKLNFKANAEPDSWSDAVIAMVNGRNSRRMVNLQNKWMLTSKWQEYVNRKFDKNNPPVEFVLSVKNERALKQLDVPCVNFGDKSKQMKIITKLMSGIYGHNLELVIT